MNRIRAVFVVIALSPGVAYAHPGHGVFDGSYTFWHYMSEPAHITALAALSLVGLLVGRLMPTRRGSGPA